MSLLKKSKQPHIIINRLYVFTLNILILSSRVNVGKKKMHKCREIRTGEGKSLGLTAVASLPISPDRCVRVQILTQPPPLCNFFCFFLKQFPTASSSVEGRCYRHRCTGPNSYQIQVSGSGWVDCPAGGTTQVVWHNNNKQCNQCHAQVTKDQNTQ